MNQLPQGVTLTPHAKALEAKALGRIKRQNQAIVLRPTMCFFAPLVLRLRVTCAWWQQTAATDGKHLFYNPAFIDTLTDAELCGLIVHEVLHCANGHVWRRDSREAELWNHACDYAINPIVLATRFGGAKDKATYLVLPKDGLLDDRFKGKSAEQIYAVLRDERSQSPKPKHGGNGTGKGDEQATAGPGGQQPAYGPADPRAPKHKPTFGEILDPAQEDAVKSETEWRQAVIQAAEAAKQQGHLPSDMERLIDHFVQPKVDWKSVLRRFVQQLASLDYNFSYPSGRYLSSGLYMPRLRSENMPPIVIGVDTSGSIGQAELTAFTSEISSIIEEVRPELTYVVYCDAAIAKKNGVQEFQPGDALVFRPTGGGGTDFNPVFEWVEKQGLEPACLIYLTDCMGDYPDDAPGYPTLWASSTKEPGRYEPPFGEFLYIGE